MERLFAGLGLVCLSVGPAWAEEGHSSLPQLDPSFYPGELFWLFVCFPLFFLMMQLWAVPKFQRTQENRQQILEGDLSAARKASDGAKKMMAEGEKTLANARAEVRKSVEGIIAVANEKAADQRAKQEKDIAVRMAEANAKIDAARQAALKDVPAQVADLVSTITAKVLSASAAR
jgi:F-type H+-transporting ATPase subunit b